MFSSLPFRGDDQFVAVMGARGAGKTGFISQLAARVSRTHSHTGLKGYAWRPELPTVNKTIHLIETPDLDDPDQNIHDSFLMLKDWVLESRNPKVKFDSIIYFHPLNGQERPCSILKHTDIINALCEPNGWRRVSIVITMWDKVGPDEARKRVGKIKSTALFADFIGINGVAVMFYGNDRHSATEIVLCSVFPKRPVLPNIQEPIELRRNILDEYNAIMPVERQVTEDHARWEKESETIRAKHQEDLNQKDLDAKVQIGKMSDDHSQKLDQLRRDHERAISQMRSFYEDREEKHQEALTKLDQALAELQKVVDRGKEDLSTRVQQMQEDHVQDRNSLQKKYERDIVKLELSHEDRASKLHQALAELQKALDQKEEDMMAQVQRMQGDHDQEKNSLRKNYELGIVKSQISHKYQVTKLQDTIKDIKEAHKRELESLRVLRFGKFIEHLEQNHEQYKGITKDFGSAEQLQEMIDHIPTNVQDPYEAISQLDLGNEQN